MKCCDCGEEIPKDAIIIEETGGGSVCPKCSGLQSSTLGQEKDIDSVSMSTQEELELGRALFEGAGQLKGQKIERAQIVYHLKALANGMREILPNSLDAHVISDIAFMLERREHWTKLDTDDGPDGD